MSINWYKLQLISQRNSKFIWGSSLGIGGLLYLKVWLPLTNIGVPCVFQELTGFYCPGCGITRAALSLLKLDLYQAYRYNSLMFILLPLYLTYSLINMKQMRRTSNAIMTVMVILALAYGLFRNIPAWDWLAPTAIR